MSSLSLENPRIQPVFNQLLDDAGVSLALLREDMNHPPAGGNKWWKLKYNLQAANEAGQNRLLTFGGAWSNHIYATAAAARIAGFESIGIIRGERILPLNPVLSFAENQGMKLKFIQREAYSRKADPDFLAELKADFGDFYLIPEGGANEHGMRGCAEWGEQLAGMPADYICLPCGTGTSGAGIIAGLNGRKNLIGFSVLKGDFMTAAIEALILKATGKTFTNWRVEDNYHFGGYAKSNEELAAFVQVFNNDYGIPIEPVYTGKMMYGIFDLLRNGVFERGARVMAIHTGGVH